MATNNNVLRLTEGRDFYHKCFYEADNPRFWLGAVSGSLFINELILKQMITTKELNAPADFETLKKGDLVACEFHRDMHDHPRKSFRFKVFEIVEVKTRTKEIILQTKNNLYFNYEMFIDPSDGASNLKSAVLLNCH